MVQRYGVIGYQYDRARRERHLRRDPRSPCRYRRHPERSWAPRPRRAATRTTVQGHDAHPRPQRHAADLPVQRDRTSTMLETPTAMFDVSSFEALVRPTTGTRPLRRPTPRTTMARATRTTPQPLGNVSHRVGIGALPGDRVPVRLLRPAGVPRTWCSRNVQASPSGTNALFVRTARFIGVTFIETESGRTSDVGLQLRGRPHGQ